MNVVPLKPLTDEDIPWDGQDTTASNLPDRTFPQSWRLLNDVELLDLPDPEYIIHGCFQRKGIGFVYGQPGTGKTQFLAQVAVSICTGTDFFGHRVQHPGVVVYVGAERRQRLESPTANRKGCRRVAA